MNWKRLVLCLLISSLLLTSCGIGSPKTVKVVVSLPLDLGFCQDMANAAQLALDEAGGKVGNTTVELVGLTTSDPNGSPVSNELEKVNAEEAVADPEVVAFLGPLSSGQAKLSMPILNQVSIVQVSASTTWPGLTKPGYGPGEPGIYYPTGRRHFFRVVPSDEIQGAAAARWAAQLGYNNVYVVYDTSPYGAGVSGVFVLTAGDIGLTIVAQDPFDPETVGPAAEPALQELADQVVAAQPDLLYLAGGFGANGEVIAKMVREQNPNLPIMGPDALQQDDLITALGADLAEGFYATTVGIPASQIDSPAAAAFLASYQAAYGKEPSPYVVATYEAMKVLLAAIERAEEPTREGILEAMQSLGEYSGVFGDWHFDERGDISLTAISGMQIQNGAWEFVQIVK